MKNYEKPILDLSLCSLEDVLCASRFQVDEEDNWNSTGERV